MPKPVSSELNRPARHRWRYLLFGAVFLAAMLCSVWVGYYIREANLAKRISEAIEKRVLFARSALGDDTRITEWRTLVTNLHTLEYAILRLGPYIGHGGGIAEIDGQLIIATPRGRLLRIDSNQHVAALATRVPMEFDLLRASKVMEDPLFAVTSFRTYDLLAVPRGNSQFDLYASHSRFKGEDCFQFVVSRLRFSTAGGMRPIESRWSDVFVARPGCLRRKDRGVKFGGSFSGGRLVLRDDRTLLVSVGDHQFDGTNDSWVAAQDPRTDLGKLVAIDLVTGSPSVVATGLRNPQGLFKARDGRIWETEHGPQGGDEINRIEAGNNYGWPLVSYGVNYGYPRRPLTENGELGLHDGFTQPTFAFVPSVGISNIAQANVGEFPHWRDDLLVASLLGNTLFRVRVDGDHVVYTEPIRFEGKRLRDITSLPDGRIAILTDSNEVIFIRNAERHADVPKTLAFTGFATLPAPPPEDFVPKDAAPEERGKTLFPVVCGSCHSLSAEIGTGPPLRGIVGRPVGRYPGFAYSQPLAEYDGPWTEDMLVAFITDPQQHFKGSTMPTPVIDWKDAPNIVAFLRTVK